MATGNCRTARSPSPTSRGLHTAVNAWMIETREQFGGAAVDVEIVGATLVGEPRPNGATVLVRWRERKRTPGRRPQAKWRSNAATITLGKIPPSGTEEIKANPLSVYVTDVATGRDVMRTKL